VTTYGVPSNAPLFSAHARARRADPATSHRAAATAESSGNATRQRTACLEAVRATPGMTAGEIDKRCGFMDRFVAGRRLPELREMGLIHNGDARVCSVRGSRQMTWYPAGPTGGGG